MPVNQPGGRAVDNSYRPILSQIQLRGSYPAWLPDLIVGLLLLVLVVSLAYPLVRHWIWRRQTYQQLASSAGERGLNQAQMALLEQIARRARLRQPLLLLTSLSAFDRHTGNFAKKAKAADNADLREQIADIRRDLGFDHTPLDQPLHTTRQLLVGQRLQIYPASGDHGGFAQCVLVGSDQRGLSTVPLLRKDEERLCALELGERLKVRFWRDGDTEYRFRSTVLECVPETTTLVIGHVEKMERIQKRDFFRLEVQFDIQLDPIAEKSDPEPQPHKPISGTVVDISGGGLGLLSPQILEIDALLQIPTKFPAPFPIAGLRCQVSECRRQGKQYKIGLEFVDISSRQQSEIVRILYQKQIDRVVS